MVARIEPAVELIGSQLSNMQGEAEPEPLMPSLYPGQPWEKLGVDLFMLGGKTHFLVVDYVSRYVEIFLLTSTKSNM